MICTGGFYIIIQTLPDPPVHVPPTKKKTGGGREVVGGYPNNYLLFRRIK